MLKGGLLAMARGVSEIVVDFPDNTARISVAIENSEKKFTLPAFESNNLEPVVPFLQQVFYFVEKNYKGETELPEIERMAINGMLETLDPHSSLLTPKVFKEFRTQTEGEFGGLGIVIGLKEGDLTVISPLEGTPAWKAGIKPKDKILKIGTEATINMNLNEAVEKLRGKIGTQVSLTVSRESVTEPFEVTLTRAKIKIDSIQSKLLKDPQGEVGYIKVKSFQEDTYRELTRNLQKLKDQSKNFKGLILDFRNDPGGLLSQAIQIGDLFLDSGVIVSTVGAGDKIREVEEAKSSGTEEKYPIIVLVNEAAASASEIVAGALKNNNRAVVIGEQTFGKGSVQSVYSLKDTSALKLTIAQYLTPGNESIQSVGITPDIKLFSATVLPNDVKILESDGFREKDLEKHLESTLNQSRKPLYTIRYFVPKKPKSDDDKKNPNPKDKSKDGEKEKDKEKEKEKDKEKDDDRTSSPPSLNWITTTM
jgi:carboxyl-terminal processing protease